MRSSRNASRCSRGSERLLPLEPTVLAEDCPQPGGMQPEAKSDHKGRESRCTCFCCDAVKGESSVPSAMHIQSDQSPACLDQNSDEPQCRQNCLCTDTEEA